MPMLQDETTLEMQLCARYYKKDYGVQPYIWILRASASAVISSREQENRSAATRCHLHRR